MMISASANHTKNASLCEEPKRRLRDRSLGFSTFLRMCENKGAMVGLVILVIIILISILAPFIAPYDFTAMDMANRLKGPTAQHLFGCDDLGRDILSRLIYGGRNTLLLAFFSSLLAMLLGMVTGAIAGYFGGWVENIIMRIMDVVQSIPGMLFSVVISAVLGKGMVQTIIALAFGGIPNFCRVLRGSILTVRKNEYVDAARADSSGSLRIILKHILPNALSPMIVQFTMTCAHNMLNAASLSFIGLGVQPPDAEWGAMLSGGRSFIRDYPHVVLFPGLAIMMTALSFNLLGDGLRDALDPKLKH